MRLQNVVPSITTEKTIHNKIQTAVTMPSPSWCAEDTKLLYALSKPHLTGIVAHAVGRVASGKTDPQEVPHPAVRGELDQEGTFGMEILKTIAGGGPNQFGQEAYGRPMKRQGASQQHIDAIRLMAEKSKSKK